MIVIIGAGLSGLLTAYRLKKENIPFKILEARDRIGGRINTLYQQHSAPLEMGATWFSSQHQNLIALLEELGIEHFEQYMEGKAFFQPISTAPAEAIQLPSQAPSFRIKGGSAALINKLYLSLDDEDLLLNQTVKAISSHENGITVRTTTDFECNQVVLAIPPKLWANRIQFKPALPSQLIEIAKETHTWMEDSIKLALSYKNPFWQEALLSGTLFSNSGPITEFYDHSDAERKQFALCGFVSNAFKKLDNEKRREHIINQLVNVFGEEAKDFISYEECIWGSEKFTFEHSENGLYPHQNNGNPIFKNVYYAGKLLISSTEAGSQHPGYMDGAVNSAEITAKKIIETVKG